MRGVELTEAVSLIFRIFLLRLPSICRALADFSLLFLFFLVLLDTPNDEEKENI